MQLGSIASNTIFPGGSGQEPHIDYPYWDYYNKEHWPVPPKHPDVPYTMNVQWVIALDDLTKENGATSVRPESQRKIEYPSNVPEYRGKYLNFRAKNFSRVPFLQSMRPEFWLNLVMRFVS